jgi:hypothetical protein
MKTKPVIYLMLLGITAGVVSCEKNDDKENAQLESQQIVLVNDTSGTALTAGSVRINELMDGNAAMEIMLKDSFRLNTVNYQAALVAYDNTLMRDSVYADLGLISGSTGLVVKSPVIWGPTSQPISYDSLVSLTGYRVKVFTDSLVQAEAAID